MCVFAAHSADRGGGELSGERDVIGDVTAADESRDMAGAGIRGRRRSSPRSRL